MAGSYDEALSFSDKAIEIDPDCGEAYGAKEVHYSILADLMNQ